MNDTDKYPELTHHERDEVVEILNRRANEAVTFEMDLKRLMGGSMPAFPGSVRLAVDREADRLRLLARRVDVAGRSEEQIRESKAPLEVCD